jgi:hypothetical protein
MNSALIQFEDGLRVMVSRNALRRTQVKVASEPAHNDVALGVWAGTIGCQTYNKVLFDFQCA